MVSRGCIKGCIHCSPDSESRMSSILGSGYASFLVMSLIGLKSIQSLGDPSSFLAKTAAEAQGLCERRIMPALRSLSISASIMSSCDLPSLNLEETIGAWAPVSILKADSFGVVLVNSSSFITVSNSSIIEPCVLTTGVSRVKILSAPNVVINWLITSRPKTI
ncbi:hypothetical protein PAEPH01_1835 [Pancytospora epiphaga]|nr:hypothetical protein PAEPH01_1835 [Pancytospora epiphaga]